MFRPNRVGTPIIRKPGATDITPTTWTIDQATLTSANAVGNVVNATPLADFGEANCYYSSATTQSLTAGNKSGIWCQFTITNPLNGDTVGIEVEGSFWAIVSAGGPNIMPAFSEMNSAATTTLEALSGRTIGVRYKNFDGDYYHVNTLARCNFRSSIIVNKTPVGGTYAVGFELLAPVACTVGTWHASFGIRQLNDQQNVQYRDTRR